MLAQCDLLKKYMLDLIHKRQHYPESEKETQNAITLLSTS